MIGKAIHIHGKVQGVGFRYSTLSQANKLGITGFVKNEYDGSIYIEAFGEKSNMNKLLHWCYSGPSMAKVLKVKATDIPYTHFGSFSIK